MKILMQTGKKKVGKVPRIYLVITSTKKSIVDKKRKKKRK